MVGPRQLHPTGMSAGQPGWRRLQCLDGSYAPHLWRGGRGRASSLSPAGPSLNLFGHFLVLQHHVGDEQSWKYTDQKSHVRSRLRAAGRPEQRTAWWSNPHTGPSTCPTTLQASITSRVTQQATHPAPCIQQTPTECRHRQMATLSVLDSTGHKTHSIIHLPTQSTTCPPTHLPTPHPPPTPPPSHPSDSSKPLSWAPTRCQELRT